MSAPTQGAETAGRLALSAKIALIALLAAFAQGCAGGTDSRVALDTGLTTRSVSPEGSVFTDEGLLADGLAMLAVLSESGEAGETALPWENPESGARGLITAFAEEIDDGRECIAFTTTRENFEGIGLYRGTACEDARGNLRLRELVSL